MMDFNAQYEAAKNLAETLKKHHQYRSVKHDGSRVFYEWNKQKICISFSEDTRGLFVQRKP
jgi:hypothetical protein